MPEAQPAYVEDAQHHGGWVCILTAIGAVLVLLCLLIRLYVRVRYSTVAYSADIFLALSGVFALIQSSLVFWEVSAGLGTTIELLKPGVVHQLQEATFAATVLYLVSIYLTKCCVFCVYLHLTAQKSQRRIIVGGIGLATAWVISAIFAVGVDCELNTPWKDIASHCSNMFIRWQIITAFDIMIEIMLFALSIYLVLGLKMRLERKSIVVTAFGFRLLVIIPAVLRLHSLASQIRSPDPTLAVAITMIWTEIQIHSSVIAAVSYCFKSFTAAVSTSYGSMTINLEVYDNANRPFTGQTSGRTETNGVSNPISSSKTPSLYSSKTPPFTGHPGSYSSHTTVTGGRKGTTTGRVPRSRNSGESQVVIIREDVHVESGRASPTSDSDNTEAVK